MERRRLVLVSRVDNVLTRRVAFRRARKTYARPLASFTFDDFPRSAWTAGGAILERRGAKATYYTAGGLCGVREDGLDYFTADDLRAVHAAGHEIGCHSFSHRPAPQVPSGELVADFQRNQAFVDGLLGPVEMTSFAYPFGHVSLRTKRLAGRRYAVSRGYRWGVNRGTLDLDELRTVHLEARSWSAADVESRVETARSSGGWIVFLTHDVSFTPTPYGATPEIMEHALDTVQDAGFEVLTVKDALARATAG
jgi:peptidoglycan/xylan/chitin deacetylase (PgdA/CDA1 family)